MVQPGEIEKIQERLKKIETSVIPPRLKRMYLETEEKEVNPLYVSLDVKYIKSWICENGILDDLCLTLVDIYLVTLAGLSRVQNHPCYGRPSNNNGMVDLAGLNLHIFVGDSPT